MLQSPSDNDEVDCCINITEFVIKSYLHVLAFSVKHRMQIKQVNHFCSVCYLRVAMFCQVSSKTDEF